MSEEKYEYKVGEPVIYYKGDNHLELGIIKRISGDNIFVRYHMGDTAANTPHHMLRPIHNNYAFNIIRKDVEEAYQTQHARQIATVILDGMEEMVEKGSFELKDTDYLNCESMIARAIEETKNEEFKELDIDDE